jgi:hypothetical protein
MAESRRPRILHNDDGWIMYEGWPPLTADDLKARIVDLYAGSPVTTVCWCVGDREVFDFETKVGQRFGDGVESFDDPALNRQAQNLQSLIDDCGGPLTALCKLCHEADLELFADVRMNSHYDKGLDSPHSSKLRREHPEFLIGRGEYATPGTLEWGIRAGLDYGFPEVREHVAAVLIEMFEDFDVDGLELDFMRHPAFFRPLEAYANRYLMTDMIRHVKSKMNAAAAKKGRKLELAVRVQPTLHDAARIGLDVREWIREGLVDIVIAGGGFIPFEAKAAEFVEAAKGTDCQILGGIESLRPAIDDEAINSIAARFWDAGVDGLHFFNYYHKSKEWMDRQMGVVADRSQLRSADKRYHMEHTDRITPRDLHDYAFRYAVPVVQLPIVMTESFTQRGPTLNLWIDDDLSDSENANRLSACTLTLKFENLMGEDEVEIVLNGIPLSSRDRTLSLDGWSRVEWTKFPERVRVVDHVGGVIACDLAERLPRRGENLIEVKLIRRSVQQDETLILKDVELTVEYAKR